MDITFGQPNDKEFQHLCDYIKLYELDNRELKSEQFTVAFRENEIVGFGRLRKYTDFSELCSLAVIMPYRRQGIGKAIVSELLKQSSHVIFLVSIIPEFFIPFGFNTISISEYPAEIMDKWNYCTQQLKVPEKYVAMKLRK